MKDTDSKAWGQAAKRLGVEDRSRSPGRSAPSDSSRPLFRDAIRDIFLSNKLSAPDIHNVIAGASASGASGVADLAAAGHRGTVKRNLSRDLMRKFLKNTSAPPLYSAKIKLWDVEAQTRVEGELPFLLPHEMMYTLKRHDPSALEEAKVPPHMPELAALLQRATRELGSEDMVALGLHGDGVPYLKKESLEIMSWNFPGCPVMDRVPLTAVPKKHVCQCGCRGGCTWDCILAVVTWSLQALAVGLLPTHDHEGAPLGGAYRKSLGGQPIGVKAVLLQVRGDWPFLRQLFRFPSWSSHQICWKCTANQETLRSCGRNAPWREGRQSERQFYRALQGQGLQLSPLFSAPAFKLSFVVIDWMHTVDLGVGQELVGNVLWELVLEQAAPTQKAGVLMVFRKLKEWYREHKPRSMLDNLTVEMLKPEPSKPPRLKAKAGETRYLVPCMVYLTDHWLEGTLHQQTAAHACRRLFQLQQVVSTVPYNAEQAATHCREFCLLYASLAEEAVRAGVRAWAIKPKLHMLQELVEYGGDLGSPATFWTYQDESWVGLQAKVAHRRGGRTGPAVAPTLLLQRYRCSQV